MQEKSQEELLREVERRIALLSQCEAEWESLSRAEKSSRSPGAIPISAELTELRRFLDRDGCAARASAVLRKENGNAAPPGGPPPEGQPSAPQG